MRHRGLVFIAGLVLLPRAAWPQGVPQGPEFRVNTYTTSPQGLPSVAADSSGSFVVVWQSYTQDGSLQGIFGQRYASSGTPAGPEFRVNTYTTGTQAFPAVAADASGDFVVVWTSYTQDGSYAGVFAQRHASSGTPLGPEFRVNTFTTGYQRFPSVAADASGNFVVVWQSDQTADPDRGVFGQRYASSGAPLGPEFRVNTFTTFTQSSPSVASDASGNFVVVWTSVPEDHSGAGIFGQRYASSGTPLGPEFQVNTFTTGYQVFASVAADATGDFVVAWASNAQDGSSDGVFGQRYASSGASLGPEFRVNSFTTGQQRDPAVAADSSGNFVVAWASYGQDGSSDGIFAQRYTEIVPVELMRFGVE